ncbi:hypothetical protein NLG97_g296 [Lecanicillium saksenae]|uniref:Uncharacterized protein n=1 Tax=Lecanicillium saksenae TaxID=468837 RepID=A0ACC1R7L0_9HYPO|nr:hypothetical protein NLG97_g296 [Lecanicillium saksenae]
MVARVWDVAGCESSAGFRKASLKVFPSCCPSDESAEAGWLCVCVCVNFFDLILPHIAPTRELLWEAEQSHNMHFKEALKTSKDEGKLVKGQAEVVSEEIKEPTEMLVSDWLWVDSIWEEYHPNLYAGQRANTASLELYLMTSKKVHSEAAASEAGNYALYQFDHGVDRKWDESIVNKKANTMVLRGMMESKHRRIVSTF